MSHRGRRVGREPATSRFIDRIFLFIFVFLLHFVHGSVIFLLLVALVRGVDEEEQLLMRGGSVEDVSLVACGLRETGQGVLGREEDVRGQTLRRRREHCCSIVDRTAVRFPSVGV